MMGKYFRITADHKQRVNRKRQVEFDSAASSGGQGKYNNYVSFLLPPFEAALSILKSDLVNK
jgi:hypothetical protein